MLSNKEGASVLGLGTERYELFRQGTEVKSGKPSYSMHVSKGKVRVV